MKMDSDDIIEYLEGIATIVSAISISMQFGWGFAVMFWSMVVFLIVVLAFGMRS